MSPQYDPAVAWRDWIRGVEVTPSLYAADFRRLGQQIDALLAEGCRVFHFDCGDGHFIPPVTMGPVVVRSIAPGIHAAGGVLDCHLMVDDPIHHLEEFAASGADSVSFHVEAVVDAVAGDGLATIDPTLGDEWPAFRHRSRPELLQTLPHLHATGGFFVARLLVR